MATQEMTATELNGLTILQSARHYLCTQPDWNADKREAWQILNNAANRVIWGWLQEREQGHA